MIDAFLSKYLLNRDIIKEGWNWLLILINNKEYENFINTNESRFDSEFKAENMEINFY